MNKVIALLIFLFGSVTVTHAQKVFEEGVIRYHVIFHYLGTEPQTVEGTYTFTVKGKMIRKELKLDNGYDDIVIINGNNSSMYSLHTVNGKKYAVQHDLEQHIINDKEKYNGFSIRELPGSKKIGGYVTQKAEVVYTNSSSTMYYTKTLTPSYEHMYDEFPNIQYIPLEFSMSNEKERMNLIAEKIEEIPVESNYFRIPEDYKMISYNEYKELNK